MSNNFILMFIMLVSTIRTIVTIICKFINKKRNKVKPTSRPKNGTTDVEFNGPIQNNFENNFTLQNKPTEEEQKDVKSKCNFNNAKEDKLVKLTRRVKEAPLTSRRCNNNNIAVEEL